jgi:hypothetical protein
VSRQERLCVPFTPSPRIGFRLQKLSKLQGIAHVLGFLVSSDDSTGRRRMNGHKICSYEKTSSHGYTANLDLYLPYPNPRNVHTSDHIRLHSHATSLSALPPKRAAAAPSGTTPRPHCIVARCSYSISTSPVWTHSTIASSHVHRNRLQMSVGNKPLATTTTTRRRRPLLDVRVVSSSREPFGASLMDRRRSWIGPRIRRAMALGASSLRKIRCTPWNPSFTCLPQLVNFILFAL